jgi:hypothetical protein
MAVSSFTSVVYAGYGDRNKILNVTGLATALLVEAINQSQSEVTFVADNDTWGTDPSPNHQKYFYVVWQGKDGGLQSGVVAEYDSRGVVVPTGL